MRWVLAAAFAIAVSFALAPAADAKGCIKGAIVGGVAGHMAGHGKLGAAAGCVVGQRSEQGRREQGERPGSLGSEVIRMGTGGHQRRRVPPTNGTAVRIVGIADLPA
jgi:hypothetical protein